MLSVIAGRKFSAVTRVTVKERTLPFVTLPSLTRDRSTIATTGVFLLSIPGRPRLPGSRPPMYASSTSTVPLSFNDKGSCVIA